MPNLFGHLLNCDKSPIGKMAYHFFFLFLQALTLIYNYARQQYKQ